MPTSLLCSLGGMILSYVVADFPDMAAFQPVMNGKCKFVNTNKAKNKWINKWMIYKRMNMTIITINSAPKEYRYLRYLCVQVERYRHWNVIRIIISPRNLGNCTCWCTYTVRCEDISSFRADQVHDILGIIILKFYRVLIGYANPVFYQPGSWSFIQTIATYLNIGYWYPIVKWFSVTWGGGY